MGALAFAAFPVERSDHVASHGCSNRAFSLGTFAVGTARPDENFYVSGRMFVDGSAEFICDGGQRLTDELLRLFLDQAPAGTTRQHQREGKELYNQRQARSSASTGQAEALAGMCAVISAPVGRQPGRDEQLRWPRHRKQP
jgi:hypothetical protein